MSPTDTLREAVARAIYEADEPWSAAFPWPHLERADDIRAIAGAALSAIEAAGWRVVKARATTGVTVAPYGDEIVVLMEEDNDMVSAILDASYATELRDGLTEALAAPRLDATVRSGEEG